jgi:hypothetical protein
MSPDTGVRSSVKGKPGPVDQVTRAMLTAWMISQQERFAPSPWSADTRQLLRKYTRRPLERDRQLDELTLVAVHGISLLLATVGLGLVAWLTSLAGTRANATFATMYACVAGGLCAGLVLHLARYYDALICRVRAERDVDGNAANEREALRWPRASSDADLVVVIAVSAYIFLAS